MILREVARVESTLSARLGPIEAQTVARVRFKEALALFRGRLAQDAALVAKLGRRWDGRLLDTQLERDRVTNARLVSLWSALGSKGCAQYFRVATGHA